MKKYDVIIIGAGPAGLKCAETLKDSGKSVLLLEKNKTIGPKVCGGGLTNFKEQFGLTEEDVRSFKKQIFHTSKKRYEIKFFKNISIVDRDLLGKIMLSNIKDYPNINILTETIVTKIEKDKVITNRGDFSFKYLVGADGANSIVRRFLKLKTKFLLGLVYRIPKITNELEIFTNDKKIKEGYIWIFPHKTHSNIGIGFDPKKLSPAEARKILEDFLEENHMSYSNCKLEGAPLSVLYKGCIFGNIYLAGEAAGLTSRTSGEGIKPAVISGAEIAQKIINPKYELKELKKVMHIKKFQESFAFISNLFPSLKGFFFRLFIYLMKKKKFQKYFI
ncbi:MAG: hypothetical protein COV00_01255 [Candidatus Tagabacteria bacterium CG10_big_fil_rev_8_21_14_0_10_40_13]|uniref:Digeranylgeranylglycerophospholipid reductase catalytic domain-containing protein n=1 Tax=Candidatus Tagabacteria bacterium CG10_big_fil_rev_8_21_14_0_10_40_13 TaxID=1975022 RepID=A0A2M8L997_9BACT|nr:MAG: hypothetical protein COV00_01255 [Candidatus Tagabacteria bacterium CG10_big_fil_rev_8_21_14_0_10_40_13]